MGVLRHGWMMSIALALSATVIQAQSVVINEIHYHPIEVAPDVAGDAEFVELHNPGGSAVDISGWTLSGYISPPFTFPASTSLPGGGYVVVAKNITTLQAASGYTAPYQWGTGGLANSTEPVILSNASSTVIDSVTYDDDPPWPTSPDGNGPTLELLHPDFPNEFAQAWRGSVGSFGTPGAQNSVFSSNPVVITESPLRATLVASLPSVSVTFAENVVNVAAGNLTVNGSAATSVSGSGAGPYVFSGYAVPSTPVISVALAAGSIQDGSGNSFAGDAWSYSQNLSKIVINEISYHPEDPNGDAEFVELYNNDSTTVNVGGWQLGGFSSIPFTFPANTMMPAGTYIVVSKNTALLSSLISVPSPLYQWPDGSLANSSEPVVLTTGVGVTVDSVTYADASPWPTSPDGDGPTLELLHPDFPNQFASVWRASAGTNGTPGSQNSVFSSNPVVLETSPAQGAVITTLPSISVTFSEAVTGVAAGNLTVDGSPATSVSGSGSGPYVFSGFAQPSGGAVNVALAAGAIQDLAANAFTGTSWGYTFDLAEVVINEIHYHPADSAVASNEDPEALQFFELYNRESTAVNLSNWVVSSGITFTFPNGASIAANGFVLVAADGAFLQSKIATIPPGTPIYTWTSGNLSNSGEELEISDSLGNVIDAVTYTDSGEWPTSADGGGPSLELINPGLPNQFAGAWRPSLVTNGTPGQQNGRFVAAPAPLILSPAHFPSIPTPNSAVLVTTGAIDDDIVPPTVTLHYRQDVASPGAYTDTPMFDDGLHGDGDAEDGVYGATMPGLPDGSRYDFYITADDGSAMSTYPANHQTANPSCSSTGCQTDINPACVLCQTLLCKFSGETLQTDVPTYHIIVTQTSKSAQESLSCNTSATAFDPCKAEFDATFVDDQGNVFYNVTERYRGQSSITLNPRSYRVDFPSDNPLQSTLGFPVRKMVLNGNNPTRQVLGFNIFNAVGLPASHAKFVRLRYTGINYDSTAIGSNGFNGLYGCIEQVDSDFLDSQDGGVTPDRGTSSDGNLYRGENNANFDWRGTDPAPYRVNQWGRNGYSKENNEEEDIWSDLIPLLDTMNNSPAQDYAANVAALLDEDECLRYFAMHNILGNKEGGIYRDTGDDYYLYFNPPGHPNGFDAKFILWDTDSILIDSNTETIWRTGNSNNTIATIRNFIRHNAFAPIFVKDIVDIINGPLSQANFDAIVDGLPNGAFFTSGGSANNPATRAQFKAWYAARLTSMNNEIRDNLTLTGVPSSPYTNANPVIALSGQINQAGTHNVTVNGQQATFSVYLGTWSYNYTLRPGVNQIIVRAFDRDGQQTESLSQSVYYNPPPASLRLTMPTRMIDTKTLTLKAELLDSLGNIHWRTWNTLGTVSAKRVSDQSNIPTSITVFETLSGGAGGGTPPADSIRFYNGVGSVSITLDAGAAVAAGDIEVTVTVGSLTSSKIVNVLDDAPGIYKNLSGTLAGADLTWSPADGVIHLTGNVTIGNGNTLTIQPGTLIMVDAGPVQNGTAILSSGTGHVLSQGTQLNPVFFFATNAAAAMTLPQTQTNNDAAWRGFDLNGSGTSSIEYTIITGAGNGIVTGHPRPPIIRTVGSHSLSLVDSVFADCPGLGHTAATGANGTYNITRCLFSRMGIGGEWLGTGYTLIIEDSWFTRIGRAPEPNGVDGDSLHLDRAGNTAIVRGCVLTDCGDDMIDHSTGATPTVENCIIYDARDKAVSLDGSGTITMTNCLVFNCPGSVRCSSAPAFIANCTFSQNTTVTGPNCTSSTFNKNIFWTTSIATCCGTVNHNIVGNPADLGCGTGNQSINPNFFNTSACQYEVLPTSPAFNAGPNGELIGWLGFPTPDSCVDVSHCDDNDPCTTDSCVNGECQHAIIPGCQTCTLDAECDDGLYCNGEETCGNGGTCEAGTPVDCGTGTCDESIDACVECLSSNDCDDGNPCNGVEVCLAGVCQPGSPPDCSAFDSDCTVGVCNPGTGQCEAQAANEGGSCDDGFDCTSGDACASGVCEGVENCPPGQSCDGNGVCATGPQTVTFQNGVSGYAGTQDTFLQQAAPDAINGASVLWEWDNDDPSSTNQRNIGLIRFDAIFGTNPGQIPPNATINSATLRLYVNDPSSGTAATVNHSLVDWSEATATWNNFGGDAGLQVDETGAQVATGPTATGLQTVNVTASLQAWLMSPAQNFGWLFIPTATDGVEIRSSETATIADRPLLTVEFVVPAGCQNDGECDDGVYCNGAETCDTFTGVCQPGAPPCGGDGCDETADACVSAVTADGVGARYISVTPAAGTQPVAIRVENLTLPCLPRYAGSDGRLTDTPVYLTPAVWGTLLVSDREIMPDTTYEIFAESQNGVSSPAASATTHVWGNVNNTDGIDIFDILCVLDGFGGSFAECSLSHDDLLGVPGDEYTPDHAIDLLDVMAVLDAYSGLPYGDADPCDLGRGGPGQDPGASAVIALQRPKKALQAAAGSRVQVDVYVSNAYDLRGYQLEVEVLGANSSAMKIESIVVDQQQPTYVFGSIPSFIGANQRMRRVANSLQNGGVNAAGKRYLATIWLMPSKKASGVYTIRLKQGGQTMLLDSMRQEIPWSGAAISVTISNPDVRQPGVLQPVGNEVSDSLP